MMLLGYLGKPSATVTYSIDNADLTEHTAETGTGVVTLKEGTPLWLYVVDVASPPIGGLIHWYEDGVHSVSEIITQPDAAVAGDAMTLTAAYDAAKAAASQASVNAVDTVVDGIAADYAKTGEAASAVASLGYVAPDNASAEAAAASAASADGKLTAERLAKLDGAAQEATLEAVKLRTDTLDAATGTLTLSFRLLLDSDGDGIADVPAVGVGGVTCHLLAHGTHTRIRESATTDSQGYVYWHGLAAGTYDVDPDAAGYEGVTVAVTIPE